MDSGGMEKPFHSMQERTGKGENEILIEAGRWVGIL